MKHSLLERLLKCPFCGGKFDGTPTELISDKIEHGILTCYCSRFPVVAGIPVLKRDKKTLKAVSLIESGRHFDAFLTLIEPDTIPLSPMWRLCSLVPLGNRLRGFGQHKLSAKWREQAEMLLSDPPNHVTVCELLDFYFQNHKGFYDYFAFRLGQPRHLVALSLATFIHHPPKLVLDLCCGFGPMIPKLMEQANGQQVVGVEESLFALYVAKYWMAPEAEYICCSAENALPFVDKTFSAVFCSDAFQCVINKHSLVHNLSRIADEGIIVLTALPNKLVSRDRNYIPLSPEGYRALFHGLPNRILADKDILDRYLLKRSPDLSTQPEIEYLNQERLLSIVIYTQENFFSQGTDFVEWPHAMGRLGINPFYEIKDVEDRVGKFLLQRRFLSRGYDEDNPEYKKYMPEEVECDSSIVSDLIGGKRTPAIEKLIEQCVVIDIPDKFYNARRLASAG